MQMSTFQLVVLCLFGFFILAGVGTFAAFGGLGGDQNVGAVMIWGTADENQVNKVITNLLHTNEALQEATYIQKDSATYERELVDAMAAGTGPDLFLVDQSSIQTFANKISPIPYESISQNTYLGSFINQGQLFLRDEGILALPFTVDPLVMYWNKNHFAAAGEGTPPQYWKEFVPLVSRLTISASGSEISRSTVALGEWSNIRHAKAILSALFLQSGDKIVVIDPQSKQLRSVFGMTPETAPENPAQSALSFYTQFADPGKTSYTWNRALPESRQAFVAGKTSVYFGLASDYRPIAESNPNLSFGVGVLPQIQGSTDPLTYGVLVGLAIPRTAKNPAGALVVAGVLAGQAAQGEMAQATGLPSVRTDVRLDTAGNAAADVFLRSALISRGFYDPNAQATESAFKSMVESVLSGRTQPAGAVGDAAAELSYLTRARQ